MASPSTITLINRMFVGTIRARITPAIANMMEASPLFMSWLTGANAQNFRFEDNPNAGTVLQPNERGAGGVIFVDPSDFNNFSNGSLVIRFAHELGHAVNDANGLTTINGYTNPFDYTRARGQDEGAAHLTEWLVAKQIRVEEPTAQLTDARLDPVFRNIEAQGAVNGLSAGAIQQQTENEGGNFSRGFNPSDNSAFTYRQVDYRDFAVYKVFGNTWDKFRNSLSPGDVTLSPGSDATNWQMTTKLFDSLGTPTVARREFVLDQSGFFVEKKFNSQGQLTFTSAPTQQFAQLDDFTEDGRPLVVVTAPSGDKLFERIAEPDGSTTVLSFGTDGRISAERNILRLGGDDDISSIITIKIPGQPLVVEVTDFAGYVSSRATSNFDGTETVQRFTASGRVASSTVIQRFDDGTRLEEVTNFTNGAPTTVRNTYSEGNELLSSQPVVRPGPAALTDGQSITVLNDIAGLIGAIQGGQPIPILNSGLRLVNSVTANAPIPSLVTAGQIVGGLASLYNLSNALRNGDTLTQINATLSTLNYVNQTLPQLLSGPGAAAFSPALNGFLNGTGGGLINGGVPGVLPVLGLILSIRSGDPLGIVSGLIGVLNPVLLTTPPVGWILAGLQILRLVFASDPPEAWGIAKFVSAPDGSISIDTQGVAFGPQRVRQQLAGTQAYLQSMIAFTQLSSPETPLGIIPQRTASITWREARQNDKGYAINDIDPITGTQRYPFLRWDDDGVPFSANPSVWQPDPTDPNIRVAMTEQLIASALRREAIAPIWEVNTARMQQDAGDPLAGLTEAERAARSGLGATYDATSKKPLGQFRAVTLDLDGNGTITLAGKDETTNTVAFDWDDSGFNKQVAWVKPNDGFLFLDRDSNGVVSSGKELFSNSLVSDDYKGVRSIEWVDANRDGKIDALDPVFAKLKIWQDINGDGDSFSSALLAATSTSPARSAIVTDPGELKTLAELGITELDYVNGRFTRNGVLYAMKSDQLEADANGTLIAQVGNGITIDYSDGRSEFIITQVTSLAGGADRIDGLYEDGDPNGAPRATPLEIVIPVALLLANDGAEPGAAGLANLSITGVSGAEHGGVRLGDYQGQPAVFFTPLANYNSTMGGDARFQYTLRNTGTNEQKNLTVTLPLAAVIDVPVVSAATDASKAVYGYGTLNYSYPIVMGEDASTVYGSTTGAPIYTPYLQEIANPIYGDVRVGLGEDAYTTWGIIGYNPSTIVNRALPIAYESPNTGTISAIDPDGSSSFSYELMSQALYGNALVDQATGRWTYTGRRPGGVNVGDVNSDGSVDYANPDNGTITPSPGNIDSNRYSGGEEQFTDVFTVKVTDTQGAQTLQDVSVTHYGPRPLPVVQNGGKKPIAIDLDGDGFHFTDVDDSNVFLDINGDGWRRRTAWLEPGDGLLTFDENNNGIVDSGLELSFARFVKGAQTDLEGLRAFDTSKDGVFSAADAAWSQFGVWQDANANGITDAGELRSLASLGIEEIALTSNGQFQVINGQTVHGTGAITKTDGATLAMADVTLGYSNEVLVGLNPDGSPRTTTLLPTGRGQTLIGGADKDLALGTNGSDSYVLGEGDDVLVDDMGNDEVNAGGGNDTLFTGVGNDIILAGAGNDQVYAGEGNDIVFGDDEAGVGAGDDLIMLQGGNDVAFGGAGKDFMSGGSGNDVISGDAGDDQLFGEEGWDALFGAEGDDQLLGMTGNDFIDGGVGADLLAGGEGADMLLGGAGDDTYEVDDALDQVDETMGSTLNAEGALVWGTGDAGGNDTVNASIGFDLSAGRNTLIENLTLTGDAAINGNGNAGNNLLVGNSAANTLRGLAGSDTLDGGLGADTLIGGEGDDTYVIDNAGDAVTELAGEGTDIVRSRVSTALTAHVENLSLIGINAISGTGNELANDIRGNAAANVLAGGQGNDSLAGGGGNDRYVFNRGDGVDTLIDTQGNSTLVLGVGISAADIEVSLEGNNLILDFTLAGHPTADRIVLQDWYLIDRSLRPGAQRVNAIEFADGRTIVLDETALNAAPTVLSDSITVDEDSANAVSLSGNVLANDSDLDAGNVLSVTNAGSYVGLYGTLTLAASGSYSYTVYPSIHLQTLAQGQSLAEQFAIVVTDNAPLETAVGNSVLNITITGNNDGPLVQADVGAALQEDGVQSASGNVLANDSDIDAGTILTVSNAGEYVGQFGSLQLLSDGSYTYSLHNSSLAVQSLTEGQQVSDVFTLQTTDGIATVASSLTLNITGTNDIPVLAGVVSAQSATEIVAFELNLPVGTFTDADAGEVLTYSATLSDGIALPTWLHFNAATQTFTGEPAYEDIGVLAITVKATDSQGASATADFSLTVNQSPELTVIGTAGNDSLRGASRSDWIDGGAGADVMRGGRGDDRYVVDNTADLITEFFNQGNDSIYSSVNYVTPAHVENLFLSGNALTASGNELNNVLIGNTGNNVLTGGAGADLLAGWLGNDSLDGGQDGDVYLWNQGDGRDTITENAGNGGVDIVRFGAGITIDSLASREFIDSAGNRRLFITVLDQDGQERADQGIELALSSTGSAVIERFELTDANGSLSTFALSQIKVTTVNTYGSNGNDTLTGSRADDRMDGGNGDDTIYGRSGNDILWGGNAQDRLFGEGGNDQLWGGNGDDWLQGGAGNDLIDGDNGADIIIAGSGNDIITSGNDGDFVDAGSGNDVIDTGNGSDFIAGGKGNDQISAGHDSDVIAFNRGDGQDTFVTQDWHSDTLSLGGGIKYSDLSLAKTGNDLILRIGQGDQITFKDWYTGSNGQRKNASRLQMVTAATGGDFNASSTDKLLNKQAVGFDFAKLVSAFDAARAGNNASANGWTVSNASLNTAYVSGSNTQAIGGDLAWRYATLNSAATQEASYGNLNAAGARLAMNGMGALANWTQNIPTPINPWIAMQAGISLIVEQPTGANPTLTPIIPLTQDQLIMQGLGAQAQAAGQARPSWL